MNNSNIRVIIEQIMSSYFKSIKSIMRKGIDNGCLRNNLNIDSAVVTYLGLIQSVILQWIISDGDLSPEKRGEEVWFTFMCGIAC